MTGLSGWENFYIIVGSAAGGLIGLQFVVITLLADKPELSTPEGISAFGTPTIIHFAAVLVLSALISIPWHDVRAASIVWGVVGFCGIIYFLLIASRVKAQTVYKPELVDWLSTVVFPLLAFAMLIVAAWIAGSHERAALFVLGASVLLLLLVGIHNAWDAVTYHVFKRAQEPREERSTPTVNEQREAS